MFRLFSVTKLVTAVAVLQLCEQGKFKLCDPISAYLPEYRDLKVRLITPGGGQLIRPARNTLTIEHLLSMQGGINGPDVEPVRRVIAETKGRAPTLAIARALAEEPLLFEPGTRFKYSWCFDVLGGLVEVLSGQTLGAYFKEHIFDPLGMKDTTFKPQAADEGRLARDYIHFNAKARRAERVGEDLHINLGTEYECPSGGLYSTVSDFILFTEALCNGGLGVRGARILRQESVENMRTNRQFDQAAADFAAFGGTSKTGFGYGLGARVLVDREKNNSLSANGEFGWDGAHGCYVSADPTEEVAIFYAQQEGGSEWWFWVNTIRNYVYASLWAEFIAAT
jgi:CubicO group peptidase (beta-lactamase class C family)